MILHEEGRQGNECFILVNLEKMNMFGKMCSTRMSNEERIFVGTDRFLGSVSSRYSMIDRSFFER